MEDSTESIFFDCFTWCGKSPDFRAVGQIALTSAISNRTCMRISHSFHFLSSHLPMVLLYLLCMLVLGVSQSLELTKECFFGDTLTE